MAYDNPIPGYGTNNTINLRLWAAKPDREFDLEAFNTGDYIQVCLRVMRSTKLLSARDRVSDRATTYGCLRGLHDACRAGDPLEAASRDAEQRAVP